MKRAIVYIDEEKCNGCGLCVPNCQEGALRIIDGKARLISDLFCDGLGACIGHCPQGAITIEQREARPYDEAKVMAENIVPKGRNTIKAHLEHLKEHGAHEYLNEALAYLKDKGVENPMEEVAGKTFCGCPGARTMSFSTQGEATEEGRRGSQLRQWPVQLHLVSPMAPYFSGKDVVLSADCVAYALGDFHKDYLKGKSLTIACPKLDRDLEEYVNKLVSLIDDSKINSLTVMTMEVPCCQGLLSIATEAARNASRKIQIKSIVVGIKGNIISDEWR
ncbi:MAG TPA: 4Fe-4S binding protein [Candidatus Nanoarchaeia archaeon]|nr:4Fe-4S binding protein [Candidatus Nanoarchaeia archaeon]